jgi:hypothetical protein
MVNSTATAQQQAFLLLDAVERSSSKSTPAIDEPASAENENLVSVQPLAVDLALASSF